MHLKKPICRFVAAVTVLTFTFSNTLLVSGSAVPTPVPINKPDLTRGRSFENLAGVPGDAKSELRQLMGLLPDDIPSARDVTAKSELRNVPVVQISSRDGRTKSDPNRPLPNAFELLRDLKSGFLFWDANNGITARDFLGVQGYQNQLELWRKQSGIPQDVIEIRNRENAKDEGDPTKALPNAAEIIRDLKAGMLFWDGKQLTIRDFFASVLEYQVWLERQRAGVVSDARAKQVYPNPIEKPELRSELRKFNEQDYGEYGSWLDVYNKIRELIELERRGSNFHSMAVVSMAQFEAGSFKRTTLPDKFPKLNYTEFVKFMENEWGGRYDIQGLHLRLVTVPYTTQHRPEVGLVIIRLKSGEQFPAIAKSELRTQTATRLEGSGIPDYLRKYNPDDLTLPKRIQSYGVVGGILNYLTSATTVFYGTVVFTTVITIWKLAVALAADHSLTPEARIHTTIVSALVIVPGIAAVSLLPAFFVACLAEIVKGIWIAKFMDYFYNTVHPKLQRAIFKIFFKSTRDFDSDFGVGTYYADYVGAYRTSISEDVRRGVFERMIEGPGDPVESGDLYNVGYPRQARIAAREAAKALTKVIMDAGGSRWDAWHALAQARVEATRSELRTDTETDLLIHFANALDFQREGYPVSSVARAVFVSLFGELTDKNRSKDRDGVEYYSHFSGRETDSAMAAQKEVVATRQQIVAAIKTQLGEMSSDELVEQVMKHFTVNEYQGGVVVNYYPTRNSVAAKSELRFQEENYSNPRIWPDGALIGEFNRFQNTVKDFNRTRRIGIQAGPGQPITGYLTGSTAQNIAEEAAAESRKIHAVLEGRGLVKRSELRNVEVTSPGLLPTAKILAIDWTGTVYDKTTNNLVPGVKRFLELVNAKGIAVYVITYNPSEEIRTKLSDLGIGGLIADVFGKDQDGAVSDLKTQHLKTLLRDHKLQPAELVTLGDAPQDMFEGRAAGVPAIGLNSDPNKKDEFVSNGAAALINDFDNPEAIIDYMVSGRSELRNSSNEPLTGAAAALYKSLVSWWEEFRSFSPEKQAAFHAKFGTASDSDGLTWKGRVEAVTDMMVVDSMELTPANVSKTTKAIKLIGENNARAAVAQYFLDQVRSVQSEESFQTIFAQVEELHTRMSKTAVESEVLGILKHDFVWDIDPDSSAVRDTFGRTIFFAQMGIVALIGNLREHRFQDSQKIKGEAYARRALAIEHLNAAVQVEHWKRIRQMISSYSFEEKYSALTRFGEFINQSVKASTDVPQIEFVGLEGQSRSELRSDSREARGAKRLKEESTRPDGGVSVKDFSEANISTAPTVPQLVAATIDRSAGKLVESYANGSIVRSPLARGRRSELRAEDAIDKNAISELEAFIPQVINDRFPKPTAVSRQALSTFLQGQSDHSDVVAILPNLAQLPDLLKAILEHLAGSQKVVVFAGTEGEEGLIRNYLMTRVPVEFHDQIEILTSKNVKAVFARLQPKGPNLTINAFGIENDRQSAQTLKNLLEKEPVTVNERISTPEQIASWLGLAGYMEELRIELRAKWAQAVSA